MSPQYKRELANAVLWATLFGIAFVVFGRGAVYFTI